MVVVVEAQWEDLILCNFFFGDSGSSGVFTDSLARSMVERDLPALLDGGPSHRVCGGLSQGTCRALNLFVNATYRTMPRS